MKRKKRIPKDFEQLVPHPKWQLSIRGYYCSVELELDEFIKQFDELPYVIVGIQNKMKKETALKVQKQMSAIKMIEIMLKRRDTIRIDYDYGQFCVSDREVTGLSTNLIKFLQSEHERLEREIDAI